MPLRRRIGYTRRTFMKDAALLAAAALPFGLNVRGTSSRPVSGGRGLSFSLQGAVDASLESGPDKNEEIVGDKFRLAASRSLSGETIGDAVEALGISFIGIPYAAHTLEAPGPEHLVINLQGLDCTTFVENVLALARCVKLKQTTFDAFKKQLQHIRYRSGVIQGYPSRLHYFTDWIADNERKQIVRDITRELGGIPLVKTINFMSTHPKSYPQLSGKGTLDAVRAAELRLSSAVHTYLPKTAIAGMQDKLRSGDIIAITTSIPGLDVSHIGLVSVKDGKPYYLHAPLSGSAVQLSQGTLADYLAGSGKQTGIIVARPMEPGER